MADHILTVLGTIHSQTCIVIDPTVTPFFDVEPYHDHTSGRPDIYIDTSISVRDATHGVKSYLEPNVHPFFDVEPYHSLKSSVPTLAVDTHLTVYGALHGFKSDFWELNLERGNSIYVQTAISIQKLQQRYFYDQYTEEVFLWALVLTHDDLTLPLRFVNDMEDHVIDGNTYTGFPFELVLADDTDDELPRAKLSIQNVDREIVENVRTLVGPINVRVSLVLASDPTVLLAGPYDFSLTHVRWDALVVEGTLDYEPVLHMSYPGYDHTPTTSPGLFRV